MKVLSTRSVGFACAAIAATLFAAPAAADCQGRHVRVDVTVDYQGGTISAPSSVTIDLDEARGPNRVCWEVTGLAEGHSLHLSGKSADDDHFPQLERSVRAPRNHINSGIPSRAGTFRYGLHVTDGSGEQVLYLDPEVVIRGGG